LVDDIHNLIITDLRFISKRNNIKKRAPSLVLAFGARDQSRGAQSEGAGAPQGGGNSKLMLLVASSAGKRASGATAPISNPKPKGCFYWCAFTIGIPHANCPHGEFRKAQNILYQINMLLVNSVSRQGTSVTISFVF